MCSDAERPSERFVVPVVVGSNPTTHPSLPFPARFVIAGDRITSRNAATIVSRSSWLATITGATSICWAGTHRGMALGFSAIA